MLIKKSISKRGMEMTNKIIGASKKAFNIKIIRIDKIYIEYYTLTNGSVSNTFPQRQRIFVSD